MNRGSKADAPGAAVTLHVSMESRDLMIVGNMKDRLAAAARTYAQTQFGDLTESLVAGGNS